MTHLTEVPSVLDIKPIGGVFGAEVRGVRPGSGPSRRKPSRPFIKPF